jgi:hypothetical protein
MPLLDDATVEKAYSASAAGSAATKSSRTFVRAMTFVNEVADAAGWPATNPDIEIR